MSHLEPILRPARESDADAIAQLHARSWRASNRGIMPDAYLDGPVVEERLALWRLRLAEQNPRHLTFVAEARDGLHGFICFELDADPVWGTLLDSLHVDPRLCGRGLGAALMRVGLARVLKWPGATAASAGLRGQCRCEALLRATRRSCRELRPRAPAGRFGHGTRNPLCVAGAGHASRQLTIDDCAAQCRTGTGPPTAPSNTLCLV